MGYLNSVLADTSGARADDSPVSGGGLSQNGKFSYGYASSPGKRSSMEDFYETRIDGVEGEIVGLFGVFDGHGGARAAEYVKQNLFSNLISHPKFITDTKSAIADAYNHTDSEFLKSENSQNRDAGSTASTAILVGDRLLVANVGDSRAVICRGGNALRLRGPSAALLALHRLYLRTASAIMSEEEPPSRGTRAQAEAIRRSGGSFQYLELTTFSDVEEPGGPNRHQGSVLDGREGPVPICRICGTPVCPVCRQCPFDI